MSAETGTNVLKIYNTQSKTNEEFVPLVPGKVSIYVCGPTVYDLLHVGNFRGPVVINMMRNWLEHLGYKVTYALNFTDVDDKIITRANEKKIEPQVLAEKYIEEYKKDFFSLGLRAQDLNPKVTESMPSILEMVRELVEKKKAYAVEGDVMYSIKAFPEYGKLSGRNPDDLIAGSRVEVDLKKQSPLDFALWKKAKDGEPFWPSPWGPGRPGWHIECSAMIQKHFGAQIDIHGGGSDLIFPHHENEIAQSEGCSGKELVKYWVHWGMLNFAGNKMSKSLGNIVSLREFVESHNAELYKWMLLSVHYRTTCDFSEEGISRAISGLARIYSALSVAESFASPDAKNDPTFEKVTSEAWKKFSEAMNDDFGTPNALAALFEVVRAFNSQVKRGMKPTPALQGKALSFRQLMKQTGTVMGLFAEPASEYLVKLDNMLLKEMKIQRGDVDAIVNERIQARLDKNFAKSDELRDKLLGMGISVMDTAQGSVWEVTK